MPCSLLDCIHVYLQTFNIFATFMLQYLSQCVEAAFCLYNQLL